MRRTVIGLCLIAVVGGCTLGPDYVRPRVPEAETYRQDNPEGSSFADLGWWEIYEDETLKQLIHMALVNNRDLRVALARIEEARARLGMVRADLYPVVGYGGTATYDDTTRPDDSTPAASAFVDASYIVDLWGRVRRSNEAALRDFLATEEAYRALTINLVADVGRAYFQLRGIDQRIGISQDTVETRRKSLDIVLARYEAGMVSEVDVHQATIQLDDALAAIERLRRDRGQTENAISLLLGQPPMDIPRGLELEDALLPPEVPAGLPSELVQRRPDVRQAEQLLAAQTARIGVAEAARFPSLTLTADLGASVVDGLGSGFFSIGANLFGPLFESGRNKRRVEVEVARTEALLNTYEQSILNAFREVEDSLIAVETFRAEHAIRRDQLRAATGATELTWARYEEGLTSFLEVLDIERSRFSSEIQASVSRQAELQSIVRLYEALGGGWNDE